MPIPQRAGPGSAENRNRLRPPQLRVARWKAPSIPSRLQSQTQPQAPIVRCTSEHPCWRQAPTWKDSVSSDAALNTSDSASWRKQPLKAALISSRVIWFARHSSIKETKFECHESPAFRRAGPDLQRSTHNFCTVPAPSGAFCFCSHYRWMRGLREKNREALRP
jgi:hypothetical protein